jgi:SAM-dependent methyltransferase
MRNKIEVLACPNCLGSLRRGNDALICRECERQFAIEHSVPCFAPTNLFYDSYAEEHCPYALSPSGLKSFVLRFVPFWSYREWRFWRRVIPANTERLLDLGCGRGRELFVERSEETAGYDSSLRFLKDCAAHYDTAALGTLPRLPFRSGAFNVVVSSHVIGHVPVADKDTLIEEIARTLRPGGITAHIIETDSDHPAVTAAKAKSAAYRQRFIDQHGHVGLEHAEKVIARFERCDFRLRERFLVDAIIPSVLNVRRFFNHLDFADLPGLAWSRRLDRWTATNSVVNAAYEIFMGAFHRTFEQWFGRPSRAQFILVAFEKPLHATTLTSNALR